MLRALYRNLRFNPRIAGTTVSLNDRAFHRHRRAAARHSMAQLRRYLRADGSPPNADRGSFELAVIGRLVPGITTAAAQSDLNSVAARIAREYPQAKGMGVGIGPATEWIGGTRTRRAMWILLGAVALLLLIACVNLANLLLTRAAGRTREMAVRSAC